ACPVIGLVTDRRVVIEDANRAATEFLCVDHARLVGKPLLHFVARRDTRPFRTWSRQIPVSSPSFVGRLRPRGGHPGAMRLDSERAGGQIVWWIVPNPEHEPTGLVGASVGTIATTS